MEMQPAFASHNRGNLESEGKVLQIFRMYATDAMQTLPHYSKLTVERHGRKRSLSGIVSDP